MSDLAYENAWLRAHYNLHPHEPIDPDKVVRAAFARGSVETVKEIVAYLLRRAREEGLKAGFPPMHPSDSSFHRVCSIAFTAAANELERGEHLAKIDAELTQPETPEPKEKGGQ